MWTIIYVVLSIGGIYALKAMAEEDRRRMREPRVETNYIQIETTYQRVYLG
jgi:hypothetical protein